MQIVLYNNNNNTILNNIDGVLDSSFFYFEFYVCFVLTYKQADNAVAKNHILCMIDLE